MSLDIAIKVDPGNSVASIAKVESELAKVERQALATQNAASTFRRIGDHMRFVEGETAKARGAVDNLSRGFAGLAQAMNTERLNGAGKAFAGLTEQIKRESDMLERIQRPLKEFEQDMQTLDMLHRRGALSASQYAAELSRIGKAAGLSRGNPIDAVSLGPTPKAAEGGGVGGMLGKAAAGIGVAYAAKEILDLSDSYTSLENRLRLVAGSQSNLNTLMDATKGIADRTRSDWSATGEAYVRLIQATKQLGVSQDRGLKITEALSMALQTSGASASEASAGTLQLMQALSSGALQGDEFRSIAENLPGLMDVFAKQLHVTRGALKQMGADGKITTDIVIKGLEAASAQIRDDFGKSVPTAAQQMAVLKNQATETAGEFVRSSGVIETLGTVLGGVAVAMKAFGGVIGFVKDGLQKLGPVGDAAKFMIKGVIAPALALYDVLSGPSPWEIAKAGMTGTTDLLNILAPALQRAEADARKLNGGFFETQMALGAVDTSMDNATSIINKADTALIHFNDTLKATQAIIKRGLKVESLLDKYRPKSGEGSEFDEDRKAMLKELQGNAATGQSLVGDAKSRVEMHNALAELARREKEAARPKGPKGPHQATAAEMETEATLKSAFQGVPTVVDYLSNSVDKGISDLKDLQKQFADLAEATKKNHADLASKYGEPTTAAQHYKNALDEIEAKGADLDAATKRRYQDKAEVKLWEEQGAAARKAAEEMHKLETVNQVALAAEDQLKSTAGSISDTLVDAANGADVAWSDFFEGLLVDMEKAILKALILQAIGSSGGGVAGAGSGVLGALFGGANGFDSMVGSGPGPFLPGFATGGDMLVGGHGGTDSKIAAFRVTPGESVHVRTPAQQQAAQQAMSQQQRPQNDQRPVVINNHVDVERRALAAAESGSHDRAYISAARRNPGAFRAALSRG